MLFEPVTALDHGHVAGDDDSLVRGEKTPACQLRNGLEVRTEGE